MEPRIRVAVCLTAGDRLLLVAHRKARHRYWLLPGGGVERGETLSEAACRELREEVGVEVEVGRLVIVCEAIEPEGRHLVNLIFAGRTSSAAVGARAPAGTSGTATPASPDGHGSGTPTRDPAIDEVRWVTRAELLKLEVHPPIARAVAAVWDAGFAGDLLMLGNVWVADPAHPSNPGPR